jgi:adenosine deaminase
MTTISKREAHLPLTHRHLTHPTHQSFFPLFSSYIYHLVNTRWALEYTTLSVLHDFASDGVVYLELRTTPRAIPSASITKASYVETILSAIRTFESTDTRLKTKLILSIDRRNTPDQAQEVVSLYRQFRSQGAVGIDLCGDPKHGPITHLAPAFEAARREMPELNLTLHFAEAEESGSEEELGMLLDWAPGRIGHVIHVPERIRERIKARGGMGLELCLSCNVHANMIIGGFEAHHFGEWWRVRDVVVALSVSLLPPSCHELCLFMYRKGVRLMWGLQTDDVGVFGSPLSNEYALVAEHFGLGRREICELARGAMQVIFGGDEEKARLQRIMWTS